MLDSFSWRLLGKGPQAAELPRRAFVHALLDIYERFGVYVGGQLLYTDLVREWLASHFRRGDLEIALDDAIAWKLVSLTTADEGPVVVLLTSEVPYDASASTAQRLRDRAADRALLLQRARLASHEPWDGTERRKSHLPPAP